jgi:uncharacterized membrane protein YccC
VLGIVYLILILVIFMVQIMLLGAPPAGGPPFSDEMFAMAVAIVLALGCLFGSWFFLKDAEKRVADYDRMRHWRDEPRRRPRVKPRQIREWEAAEREG